jgi:hypothetical protein
MTRSYYISAYATSPSVDPWDLEMESRYFQRLAENQNIAGIEHPFLMNTDRYPVDFLKDHIPAHWSLTMTTLPFMMQMSNKNASFGLASMEDVSRKAAVKGIAELRDYVCRLHDIFGRQLVRAVHIHSSPKNTDKDQKGNVSCFQHSLSDLKKMGWDGIDLNLEHCDAYIPKKKSEKGFLGLESEIEAISKIGGFGIILNWARSAIEGRSLETAVAHIELTKKYDLLKGFFFSSCTSNPLSIYGAWQDTHMPPKRFIEDAYLDNDSLLGQKEIRRVFSCLDERVYLGIKVHDPQEDKCVETSVGLNFGTLNAIEAAMSDSFETQRGRPLI